MPAIMVELAWHFANAGLDQDIIRLILQECRAHQLKRMAMRQLQDIVFEAELANGCLIEDQISDRLYGGYAELLRGYPQSSMVYDSDYSYSDA